MSTPTVFENIGRSVQDLFEENFFFTQKYTFKCKNDSEACIGGATEFGSIAPIANIYLSLVRPNLSLDKLQVKSDGRLLVEASLKTSDYSKFTVSAEDGRQEPGRPQASFGRIGCELKYPKSLTCSADIDVVNGPILKGAAVYSYNSSLSVGAEAVINSHLEVPHLPELSDLNVALAYKGPNWDIAVKSFDIFSGLKVEYLQKLPSKLSIGTSVLYNFNPHLKQGQQKTHQKLLFGLQYDFNPGTHAKLKIDSNATLSTAFRHKLIPSVDLTVCGEVNVQDWSADSHKFGIGLDFDL